MQFALHTYWKVSVMITSWRCHSLYVVRFTERCLWWLRHGDVIIGQLICFTYLNCTERCLWWLHHGDVIIGQLICFTYLNVYLKVSVIITSWWCHYRTIGSLYILKLYWKVSVMITSWWCHSRTLLWHGSRLTNWVGILSQGLRIAPPEAPITGYMVSPSLALGLVTRPTSHGADHL